MNPNLISNKELFNKITSEYPQKLIDTFKDIADIDELEGNNSIPEDIEVLEIIIRNSLWQLISDLEEQEAISFAHDNERELFCTELRKEFIGKINHELNTKETSENKKTTSSPEKITQFFTESIRNTNSKLEGSFSFLSTRVASGNTLTDRIERKNLLVKKLEKLEQYETSYSRLTTNYKNYQIKKRKLAEKKARLVSRTRTKSEDIEDIANYREKRTICEKEMATYRAKVSKIKQDIKDILTKINCSIDEYRSGKLSRRSPESINNLVDRISSEHREIQETVERYYSSSYSREEVMKVMRKIDSEVQNNLTKIKDIAKGLPTEAPRIYENTDGKRTLPVAIKEGFDAIRELEVELKVSRKKIDKLESDIRGLTSSIATHKDYLRRGTIKIESLESKIRFIEQELSQTRKDIATIQRTQIAVTQSPRVSSDNVHKQLNELYKELDTELPTAKREDYYITTQDLINCIIEEDGNIINIPDSEVDIIDENIPQINIIKLNTLERNLGINSSDPIRYTREHKIENKTKEEVFRLLEQSAYSYFRFKKSINSTIKSIRENANKINENNIIVNRLVKELKENTNLNKAKITEYLTKIKGLEHTSQICRRNMHSSINEYKKLYSNILPVKSELSAIRKYLLTKKGIREKHVQKHMLDLQQNMTSSAIHSISRPTTYSSIPRTTNRKI